LVAGFFGVLPGVPDHFRRLPLFVSQLQVLLPIFPRQFLKFFVSKRSEDLLQAATL
jgi:hypothetical protein